MSGSATFPLRVGRAAYKLACSVWRMDELAETGQEFRWTFHDHHDEPRVVVKVEFPKKRRKEVKR